MHPLIIVLGAALLDIGANMAIAIAASAMRPTGTDNWGEERLAALVTRNSMIGVAHALPVS